MTTPIESLTPVEACFKAARLWLGIARTAKRLAAAGLPLSDQQFHIDRALGYVRFYRDMAKTLRRGPL